MIQYILLGFLNYKPMTGYELKQLIDNSTAHFWHAHHSQIYTTLRQMERDGLVSSQYIQEEGQPSRRLYTLNEAGREMLKRWLAQPLLEMTSIKEDLLLHLFFSANRDPQEVTGELLLQRQLHQQKLATYRVMLEKEKCMPLPPELRRDQAFWGLTLDMGIRYETMYLEWLEETLRTIASLG